MSASSWSASVPCPATERTTHATTSAGPHDEAAAVQLEGPLLHSIHAWELDDRHDALLEPPLAPWRIHSVHRPALQANGSPPRAPEVWIANAVEQVVAAQPEGPVALLGYSQGGKLAFEVASILLRNGREVDFLGEIDALGEYPTLRPARWWLTRQLLAEATGPRGIWLVLRRGPISRIRWRLMWALASMVPPSRRAAALAAHPNGEVTRYLEPWTVATWAVASEFDFQPAPVELTLFLTESSRAYYQADDLWWGHLATGGVTTVPIAGTHTSMFDPGHLEVLAEALRLALPQRP